MKAVKYVVGLALLFALSCAAIVIGYYNSILGLSTSISLAFQELPMVTAATLMTLSYPASLVISFRGNPSEYHDFAGRIVALSPLFPFLVFLFLLPGAGAQPAPLWADRLITMYLILWGSQYAICRWLQLDFWRFARRET